MNDLRSPTEDRPYRPSTAPSPRLAQDDIDPEYGISLFDRIRYSRWFPLASVFAAVLVFSGIVSYAYKQGSQTGVNATTPVVIADTKDYKEKPANPGGMDVPFQDAVVFDQLQNKGQPNADGSKTESLLPPPEQPVANGATPTATTDAASVAGATTTASTAAPATTTTTITTPATTAPVATSATTTTTTTTPAAATANQSTTTTAVTTTPAVTEAAPVAASTASTEEDIAPAPVAKSVPAKKAVVKKTAAAALKATTTAKAEAGSYRIQLGAFRDESAARAAWAKVEKQYGQLAGVTSSFSRADLGAKGIFYRAQGINLSKSSADSLCHTINSGKAGSCIVTH